MAGMSTTRERVEDDFYATPEESTKAILAKITMCYPALEPACGQGHIAKLLNGDVTATDLVDRGYGQGGIDFLTHHYGKTFRTVITNPPFDLFTEFVKRGLELTEETLVLFGKLQALEGNKRASYLETTPLKYVYVFKKRQNPLRNGSAVDENGKPWASTMAFAWYVWEKGYTGSPQIKWL
mgnify:FL=1